jgi:hypothetical protein
VKNEAIKRLKHAKKKSDRALIRQCDRLLDDNQRLYASHKSIKTSSSKVSMISKDVKSTESKVPVTLDEISSASDSDEEDISPTVLNAFPALKSAWIDKRKRSKQLRRQNQPKETHKEERFEDEKVVVSKQEKSTNESPKTLSLADAKKSPAKQSAISVFDECQEGYWTDPDQAMAVIDNDENNEDYKGNKTEKVMKKTTTSSRSQHPQTTKTEIQKSSEKKQEIIEIFSDTTEEKTMKPSTSSKSTPIMKQTTESGLKTPKLSTKLEKNLSNNSKESITGTESKSSSSAKNSANKSSMVIDLTDNKDDEEEEEEENHAIDDGDEVAIDVIARKKKTSKKGNDSDEEKDSLVEERNKNTNNKSVVKKPNDGTLKSFFSKQNTLELVTKVIKFSDETLEAKKIEAKRKQEMLTYKYFPSDGGVVINEKRPEGDPAIKLLDHFVSKLKPHQVSTFNAYDMCFYILYLLIFFVVVNNRLKEFDFYGKMS